MKKYLYIGLILFLIACNPDKRRALVYLEKAQQLYEQADYVSAKNNLDSIKIVSPKAFEIQKQALQLMRRIEIKEQTQNLIFCDSVLNVRLAEAEAMKPGFLFEKDPQYDEVGRYLDRSQKLENKLQQSGIRTSVNELGEVSFSSVYYGSHPIHHSRLKVSKANGDYTETEIIPYDGGVNYSFVDLGMTTEIVTYTQGKDNGVVQFIYANKNLALRAEYLGKEKYVFTISQADKNALVKTIDFAVILSDIEKMRKEKEKSSLRLEYLTAKLASATSHQNFIYGPFLRTGR